MKRLPVRIFFAIWGASALIGLAIAVTEATRDAGSMSLPEERLLREAVAREAEAILRGGRDGGLEERTGVTLWVWDADARPVAGGPVPERLAALARRALHGGDRTEAVSDTFALAVRVEGGVAVVEIAWGQHRRGEPRLGRTRRDAPAAARPYESSHELTVGEVGAPQTRGMRFLCLPALIGLLSGCAAFNYGDPLGPRHAGGRVVPPGGTLEGLTVVTFNVRYGEDVEGALAELVAAGLGDAAVVLLQEMDAEGAAAIADGLGMESSLRPRNPEAECVELCKGR